MKKYLFIALAAFGLAACTDNVDDPNSPNYKGELEESYIAINLMSADLESRALEGDTYGYEDGTTEERKITTAYFFFFDENGNPFNVLGVNDGATAPDPAQQAKNHLPLTITPTTPEGESVNISDISNAVLVLNTYKGIYPKQIVAVLNWTPQDKAYSLSDLHGHLATLGNDGDGYVMSNSVYMDGAGKMVDAVAITEDSIKKNANDAKNAPIDIYVERTAAKVVLTASGKVANTENIFELQNEELLKPVGGSDIKVYMQLLGWELFNDYSNSTLLKNINTSWSIDALGLTWNDSPYFRCYWASSQDTPLGDNFSWSYTSSSFPTSYGFTVAESANYATGTYTYCGENTNQVNVTTDPRTKVILKGKLLQKNGDNYNQLEIASWYGNEYAGEEALRIAVANSLKYILYYSEDDGNSHHSIAPEHIACVTGLAGDKSYQVGFQLSTLGETKTWYQRSSDGGYTRFGDLSVDNDNKIKTNAHLAASVEPALLYESGQTYYIVDIEHLGTVGAKYGVVRNHVYQIDIKSIKGYGSPGYSGISFIKPEYPEEYEDSYVAARINVLSWKIVKQGVNIVQ